MPSPVAHLAVTPLLRPALLDAPRPPGDGPLGPWRTRLATLCLFGALVGPDIDILVNAVVFGDAFDRHGTWSHSVAFVVVAAAAFALVIRGLGIAGVRRAFLVGLAALGGHVAMDFLTVGRGVSLAWPILPDRFASPVSLFVGVRHPQWMRWDLHAVTLANELVFGAVCWIVARWWWRRRRTDGHGAAGAPT